MISFYQDLKLQWEKRTLHTDHFTSRLIVFNKKPNEEARFENLRPINATSVIVKILETMILKKLQTEVVIDTFS